MSEDFDRIRPPSERLLRRGAEGERRGADAGSRAAGREALFSTGEPGRDRAALAVRCSRCGQASGLDLLTAVRAVLPLALVAPWRRDPVFARCPACARRGWLAIEVGA